MDHSSALLSTKYCMLHGMVCCTLLCDVDGIVVPSAGNVSISLLIAFCVLV